MKTTTACLLAAALFFSAKTFSQTAPVDGDGFSFQKETAATALPSWESHAEELPLAPLSAGKCDVFTTITCGSNLTSGQTTLGQGNDFGVADYPGITFNNGVLYDAPDKLYKLIIDKKSAVHIVMQITTSGINLDMFLLTSCLAPAVKSVSGENNPGLGVTKESIDVNLDPGDYYLSIDGFNTAQVGSFTLRVDSTFDNTVEAQAYEQPTGQKYWAEDFEQMTSGGTQIDAQSTRWRRWDLDNTDGSTSGPGRIETSGSNEYARFRYGGSPSADDMIYSFSEGNVAVTAGFTTGRYRMSWRMLVPVGKKGYFNVLHARPNNSGNNANWAYHLFFGQNTAGTGDLVVGWGGGAPLKSFDFPTGAWFDVVQIIDLDNDRAELWVYDKFVASWQFSVGDGTNLLQLAGIDFYGGNTTADDYYIDNICIWRQDPATDCAALNQTYQVCVENGAKYEGPAEARCELYCPLEYEGCFDICDYGGTFIYRTDPQSGKLDAGDRIPGQLRDMPCVQAAYGGSVPENLYADIYIFHNDQPGQQQRANFTLGAGVKCFVMQCQSQILFFDAASNGGGKPASANCTYGPRCGCQMSDGDAFYDPDGSFGSCEFNNYAYNCDDFFYFVIVGPLGGTYNNFFITPEGNCPGFLPNLNCGTNNLAGETVLSNISPIFQTDSPKDPYSCYNGARPYTGNEAFYKIDAAGAKKITATLNSPDAAGLFLYSNQCGIDCMQYAGTQPATGAGTATLTATLENGTYFLVVDKSVAGNDNFNISLECQDVNLYNPFITFVTEFADPPDCPGDPLATHQVEIPNPASAAAHFDTTDYVQILFHRADGRKKSTSQMTTKWTQLGNASDFFKAYADLSGDADECGFAQPQDSLTIRQLQIDNKGARRIVKFKPTYEPIGGGNNATNIFTPGGVSEVAKLTVVEAVNFGTSQSEQLFGRLRDSVGILFSASREWAVEPMQPPMPPWLTVSPLTNEPGASIVKIKTLQDNNTLFPREALLRFYDVNAPDEYYQYLRVRQAGVCGPIDGLVMQPAPPNNSVCAGQPITLTASTPPGTVGLYSYKWSTGQTTASITVSPTATTTYQVTVTNPNNCDSYKVDQLTITIKNPPSATTSVSGQATCTTAAQIQLVTNATSPTFSWTGPNGFTSTQQSPAAPFAGQYFVTITPGGTGACTATATANVSGNTAVPTATATGGTVTCSQPAIVLGGNSSAGGSSFAWTGPNGFSSNLQNPAATAGGGYSLTVTAPNGCTATATASVATNQAAPGAAATGGTITCSQPTTLLAGSSPVPGVNYAWTGPNGFSSNLQNPTVSAAGGYNLLVTDSANGCTSAATAQAIGNNSPPGATAADASINCGAPSATLFGNSPTPGVSYSWTGPGGFSSSEQNPTASAPGQYLLTVTNPANGCTSTDGATLTADANLPNASATGGQLTCSAPAVVIFGNSTTPGAQFAWTGPGGFSSNQQNPTVSFSGNYNLTVTGPNGCTAPAVAVVNLNNAPPGATASGGQLTCATPATALFGNSPTPGATYLWTGPNGFASTLQNPNIILPGNYNLTVTNPANGCTSTASTQILEDKSPPTASATGGSLTCVNPSAQLFGNSTTPGASFKWGSPNGFSSTEQNPIVGAAGLYTLTVTGPNGCTASASVQVAPDTNLPAATATGATLTCLNPTATLAGNSSSQNVSFLWTGPGGLSVAQQQLTVSQPGSYFFKVSYNLTGCSSTVQVQVLEDKMPPGATATGGTITCAHPAVELMGGTSSGVQWAWTSAGGFSSFEQNPVVTAGGTYFLKTTGANGCTSTATATVGQNLSQPTAAIAPPPGIGCQSTGFELNATASSQGPGFFYSWSTVGGNIQSGAAGLTPFVNAPGSYTLIVTDSSNGCTASETVTVTGSADLPAANAGPAKTITCSAKTVVLEGSGDAGPNFTYQWTTANGNILSGGTTLSPTVDKPGTYTLTVKNTATNCSNSSQVAVADGSGAPSISNLPTVATITCAFNKKVLLSGKYEPAGTAAQVQWANSSGAVIGNSADVLIDAAGSYFFKVTFDGNGCSSVAQVTVAVDTMPPAGGAGPDEALCPGEAIVLGAGNNPAFQYLWSPPIGLSSPTVPSPIASPAAATVYSVAITDPANQCSRFDAVTIGISPPIAVDIATTAVIKCFGEKGGLLAVAAGGTPPLQFLWSNGAATAANANIAAGDYLVTVTDAEGCTKTEGHSLPQPDALLADVQIGKTSDTTGSLKAKPFGGTPPYSVQWFLNGQPIPGATADSLTKLPGLAGYSVVVTDGNGCTKLFGPFSTLETAVPEWLSSLKIFPNPTAGEVRVQFELPVAAPLEASITDVLGREVAARREPSVLSGDWVFDLGGQAAGVYFLRIKSGVAAVARSVVVVR